MADVKVYTLFSGSSGNCVFIAAPGTKIIIDAGKSARSLIEALRMAGGDPFDLDAVFVTHGHTDHVSALAQLMKQRLIPVHMTEETAADVRGRIPFRTDTIVTHPREYEVVIGDLTVSSFPTTHDSPGSVGYTVEWAGGRLGVATDVGCVTNDLFARLSRCDRVIIESNYDEDMLRANPRYSYPLKQRIRSECGHLSNDDCARLVCALADSGVKSFLLAHLSEENNTPEIALRVSCAGLVEGGHSKDVTISVADRHMPTFFE